MIVNYWTDKHVSDDVALGHFSISAHQLLCIATRYAHASVSSVLLSCNGGEPGIVMLHVVCRKTHARVRVLHSVKIVVLAPGLLVCRLDISGI